ncbi:MAG: SRPBCC domain-containing protein [Anaerolineales bacterium]
MLATHIAEKLQIQFEIEINAPPEKVWTKLASIEGMNEWLSKRLVFEFRQGGEFRMEVSIPGDGDFTFFGEVVKIEPLKELAFTWIEQEKGKDPWPVSTLVSFKLKPSTNGTLVSMTHTGFEALEGELARSEYEGHIVGWERAETLKELKTAVEAS